MGRQAAADDDELSMPSAARRRCMAYCHRSAMSDIDVGRDAGIAIDVDATMKLEPPQHFRDFQISLALM